MPYQRYIVQGGLNESSCIRNFGVRVPMPSHRPPPWLDRTGSWKYVEYNGAGAQGTVCLSDRYVGHIRLPGYEGIFTGAMGDCAGVALLFGDVQKHTGAYQDASLAHLPGGDSGLIKWDSMFPKTWDTNKVVRMTHKCVYNVQAVICFKEDKAIYLDPITKRLRARGVTPRQITFLISPTIPGFGVSKHGFYGLTADRNA